MNFNEIKEKEINDENKEIKDNNSPLKIEIFNMIQKNREQLLMKKNIIKKISNKLINTGLNLIEDNYDDLNIYYKL